MKLLNDIIEIITTSELRNYLFEGFKNTLTTAFIAALIGLVIGSVVAIIKIFAIDNPKLKPLALICNLYTTVIRGTPITLQLFIMVFAILAIPGLKLQQ